jgi:hypothetical protein
VLTAEAAPPRPRARLETVSLFLVAVALCVGVALLQGEGENLPGNMGYLHVVETRQVLAGRGFGRWYLDVFHPDTFLRPAYTLLLCPLSALFDPAWQAVRAAAAAVQGALLATTGLAVGAILVRAGAVRAARLAPWLVVVHPVLVSQSAALVDTMLFTVATVGAYAVAATAPADARPRRWLAAGLVLGVALLTRSTAVAIVPAVALAAGRAVRGARARLAAAGLLAVGVVAVLAPWFLRNHALCGRWMLSTVDGVNLWMGNNENTSAFLDADRSLDELPGRARYDSSEMVPVAEQVERCDAARAAALEYMRAHPGETAALAARKAADFWSVTPAPRSSRSRLGAWKDAVCALWTAPLFAFALAGAVLAWRERGALRALSVDVTLTAVLFTLPHALAWGGTRLRVPIDPLLVALAAIGAAALWARVRRSP